MNCPECGAKSRVQTTLRHFRDHVRRYRKCPKCGHTFVTRQNYEEITEPLEALKKSAEDQRYAAAKLTIEDVRIMRKAYAAGASTFDCSLMCSCDITVNAAYKVVTRKTWAWVE